MSDNRTITAPARIKADDTNPSTLEEQHKLEDTVYRIEKTLDKIYKLLQSQLGDDFL